MLLLWDSGEKFKSGVSNLAKSIPVPRGNGKDMFGQDIELNPATSGAWKKAVAHAARDGVDLPSSVTSAFRTNSEQAALQRMKMILVLLTHYP